MRLTTKPACRCYLFFFFATIALFTACQPAGEKPVEVLQYFPSGEISRRHFEINGKKEGLMTDYFTDGKVRGERLFKNDLQTGKTIFFYPQGQIKETQFFDENGLKTGNDSTFYENGKLQFLLTFQEGKKHGYVRKWSPEGEITYEARYEMDTLVEVKGEVLKRKNTK